MKKISIRDMLERVVWALAGYFASLFGIVSLPGAQNISGLG